MNYKDNWRFNVTFSASEKNVLNYYIVQELGFYNVLIENLNMNFRQIPEGFKEFNKNLRVFGEVIEHSIDINEALKGELPEKLKVVSDNIATLSKNAIRILETGNIPGKISPRTRRNLGVQALKHYINQSRDYKKGSMSRSIMLLEQYEDYQKRHLQLHRKAVIVEYFKEQNQTSIKTPYLKNAIVLKGNAKRIRWDLLLIHQKPNVLITKDTPWVIDFKRTSDEYLLDYIDFYGQNNFSYSGYRSSKF